LQVIAPEPDIFGFYRELTFFEGAKLSRRSYRPGSFVGGRKT
jgi:hypothetical protein